jgi:Uma2 family endonuclease
LTATHRGKKMQMFAHYGVREYWIVDAAAASLEIHELLGQVYVLRAKASGTEPVSPSILPRLTFPAGSLFPDR